MQFLCLVPLPIDSEWHAMLSTEDVGNGGNGFYVHVCRCIIEKFIQYNDDKER